jgi:hypothetical protein
MTKRRVQCVSLLLSLLSVLSVVGTARFTSSAQETAKPDAFASDPALAEIAHYRQWMKANEKPLEVSDASSVGG